MLVSVYRPFHGDFSDGFVKWLFDLNIPHDEDWVILGDFNFIRSPSNRNRPGVNNSYMLSFNDIIRESNLGELPVKERKYTWSNMQEDPLLEQPDWLVRLPNQ
jgi:hypothetical protein